MTLLSLALWSLSSCSGRATPTRWSSPKLIGLIRSRSTIRCPQEIRRAIADGEAGPGDRIPQAKDLAAVLGVNTNTVLRALRVLRDEGLLELGRGRAIVVAGTQERSAVVARMREFLDFARSQGYRRDEVLTMMESLP